MSDLPPPQPIMVWADSTGEPVTSWYAPTVPTVPTPHVPGPLELTDDERADLLRMLQAAEILAAAGPLGPLAPDEAELYGWAPEEVAEINAEWSAEESQAQADACQVRFSLLTKLAKIAEVI